MSPKEIKVSFGTKTLIINPPFIHFAVDEEPDVRRRVNAILGPPCLYEGEPAQHFTFPLEPRENGLIVPHLTWRDGHHHDFDGIEPRSIQRFMLGMAEWQRSHYRFTSLLRLAQDGFFALRPTDEALRQAEKTFNRRRVKMRIPEKRLEERLLGLMAVEDPVTLDQERPDLTRDQPLRLIRENGDQIESITIGYYSHSFFGAPGWYTMPPEEATWDRFESMLEQLRRNGLYRIAAEVAREMEAELNLDLLAPHVPPASSYIR